MERVDMTSVISEISVSLDGYIAGPNDNDEFPLGEGGERLHEWLIELSSWRERHGLEGGTQSPDVEMFDETWKNIGATVMGKRMFDLGEKPWGDEPSFHMPVFVVTHEDREALTKAGGTTFNFITSGVAAAVEQAKSAAADKNVAVAGGANVIQQCLSARLLDQLTIHIVPVLFGDGRRLFDPESVPRMELEMSKVISSPGVAHLQFQIAK
jgi:dihydrofolate reductase